MFAVENDSLKHGKVFAYALLMGHPIEKGIEKSKILALAKKT